MRWTILIAGEHDRPAPDPPLLELQEGTGSIGGKSLNCLARLKRAEMREGMRADLLPIAGGDQPREAGTEIIGITALVRTDIFEIRGRLAIDGGMTCPGK